MPAVDKGECAPSVVHANVNGVKSRVRRVIEPVVVNLRELDMRLLLVRSSSRGIRDCHTDQMIWRSRISSPTSEQSRSSIRLSKSVSIARPFACAVTC